MLRKVTAACMIFVAGSTAAFAGAASGYLGLDAGIIDSIYKMSGAISATGDSYGQTAGSRGGNATAFAGYGMMVNEKYYLGGELHVSDASNKTNVLTFTDSATGVTGTITAYTRYSYGISFIPAMIYNDVFTGYLRLGLVNTRFDTKVAAGASNRTNNNVTGGEAGVGVQVKIDEHFSVRGEYVFTAYRAYNTLGFHIQPTTDQVNVGIVYGFC